MLIVRFYSFLGLTKRAGELLTGEAKATNAIRKGKDCFTIIAEDASLNTKKKFENMLKYRNREYVFFGDKNQLGKSIGESDKAVIVIVGQRFANKLKEILEKLK